jgi:ribonucleoside-diphosphate reductase alpha chain
MSNRTRLQNRRGSETMEFRTYARSGTNSIPYTASISRFPDDRLAEVFLTSGRAGTDVSIQAQEAAIVLSFALQYGAPVEAIRTALPRTAEGNPEGALGMLLDTLAKEVGA